MSGRKRKKVTAVAVPALHADVEPLAKRTRQTQSRELVVTFQVPPPADGKTGFAKLPNQAGDLVGSAVGAGSTGFATYNYTRNEGVYYRNGYRWHLGHVVRPWPVRWWMVAASEDDDDGMTDEWRCDLYHSDSLIPARHIQVTD